MRRAVLALALLAAGCGGAVDTLPGAPTGLQTHAAAPEAPPAPAPTPEPAPAPEPPTPRTVLTPGVWKAGSDFDFGHWVGPENGGSCRLYVLVNWTSTTDPRDGTPVAGTFTRNVGGPGWTGDIPDQDIRPVMGGLPVVGVHIIADEWWPEDRPCKYRRVS